MKYLNVSKNETYLFAKEQRSRLGVLDPVTYGPMLRPLHTMSSMILSGGLPGLVSIAPLKDSDVTDAHLRQCKDLNFRSAIQRQAAR